MVKVEGQEGVVCGTRCRRDTPLYHYYITIVRRLSVHICPLSDWLLPDLRSDSMPRPERQSEAQATLVRLTVIVEQRTIGDNGLLALVGGQLGKGKTISE